MTKFRFKLPPTIWVLLSVVLALALAGLGLNIFNLINYIPSGATATVIYSIIIVLVSALLIIDLSIMLGGKYSINSTTLFTHFGIFKSKIEIKEVSGFVYFKKSKKLVLYYGTNKYTVIMIDEGQYDDFVLALRKVDKRITYNTQIDGEDTPE